MVIQCTKKLLDKAGVRDASPSPLSDSDPLSDRFHAWHAHVLTENRRKILFFLNDLTDLAIIYYRPKSGDYKRLDELLQAGVRALFEVMGVHEAITEEYLSNDVTVISKTSNRSRISHMNQLSQYIAFLSNSFNPDKKLQLTAMTDCLSWPSVGLGSRYATPREEAVRILAELYTKGDADAVRDIKSYVLNITLNLSHFDIQRTVEVPAHLTFADLHRVIQIVFDWMDYHCHSFELKVAALLGAGPVSHLPVRMRVFDGHEPNALEFEDMTDCPLVNDRSLMLRDIFDKEDWCLYLYDFGDNWEHIITVEERKPSGGCERPRLLARTGERPPEDVGGEEGFEEYLRIISDPDDPEHKAMLAWSRETRPRHMTDEEINQRLSWIV